MYYNTQIERKQFELLKFQIAEQTYKRLLPEKALRDLAKVTGLVENPFLFDFYQSQFAELGSQNYPSEEERLKPLTAIIGLCMDHFYFVDLPISRTVRENVDADLAPRTYNLGDVQPWQYRDLSGWDQEFNQFFRDQERLESGKADGYLPDEDFRLRYDLAGKFLKCLAKRLKELLKPLSDPIKTTERNQELRLLVMEISRYPTSLKSALWRGFESLVEKLKLEPRDAFSKLCLGALSRVIYGADFDLEKFQRGVIEYYWQQLADLLKGEEQKKILAIIKLEVEELIEGLE